MDNSEVQDRIFVLEAHKQFANELLKWLRAQNLLDYSYKIPSLENFVYLPLITNEFELPPAFDGWDLQIILLSPDNAEDPKINLIWSQLQRTDKTSKFIPKLYQALATQMPAELLELIPRSYDIIGSIAILELNRDIQQALEPFIPLIESTLFEHHPALTAVFMKAGDVGGTYRTRPLVCIAGDENPITIHKENDCSFELDITSAFFTPRLVFERKRVAHLETEYISQGKTWDVFCGVGPFLIEIAKTHPEGEYIGTDINPDAITYAQRNLQRNKVTSRASVLEMDVGQIANSSIVAELEGQISRFIMNLPEESLNYLPNIRFAIHPMGALLHIYQFNPKEDPLSDAKNQLESALKHAGIDLQDITHERIVKPFSPMYDMTVLDVYILSKSE